MKLSVLFIGFGLVLSLFVFSGTLIYDSVDSTFISNDTGWEEETRITDSRGSSTEPVVKEDGHGNAHIVWTDERTGTPQLFYAKYDGSGNVIVPESKLTKNGAPSGAADMAVGPDGDVTIAFVDAREGNWNIFIKQLDSNGIEITPSTQVSQVPIGATAKSIIHNFGKPGDLDPSNDIEAPSITDEEDRRVKQTAQTVTEYTDMASFSPSIAVDNWGNIHIVWADSRTGNFELYYSLIDQYDNIDVSELLLTETSSSSLRPLIAVDPDGVLNIVWEEVRGDVTKIYFMKLGQSHIKLKETKLVTTMTDSFSKAMDLDDDGVVHLVWADQKSGTRQVRYMAFNGKGMMAFEETTLTPPGGECFMPSVAVGNELVHVVFVHGVGSSGQNIYYKTIDLMTGNMSQAERLVPNAWGAKDLDLDWGQADDIEGTLRLVWTDSRDGDEDIFLSQAETITTLSVENTVVVAGTETVSDPMTFAAVGGLFALGTVLATDIGRWAVGASFVPLYSRLKKEKLLDQTVRDVIFRAIMEDPGVNFTGLMRSLSLKNGVLSYHLSTLEREEYIISRRDGIYRRYYPKNNGCKAPKELHEQITDIVFEKPGITQSKLARELKSRQVVNYHIKQMVNNGTIRIIRKGRQTLCYVCNWVA